MTLASVLFFRRKWRPYRDKRNIVHHATRLTKDETAYLFRSAGSVRALVGCTGCGVSPNQPCMTKHGKWMTNHSVRVAHARALVKEQFEPLFNRIHQPLCTMEGDGWSVVYVPADGHEVDCMACLTIAVTASTKG